MPFDWFNNVCAINCTSQNRMWPIYHGIYFTFQCCRIMVTNKPDIEESMTRCKAMFEPERLFSGDFVVILVVVTEMIYHEISVLVHLSL